MKLTDPEAIKALNRVNIEELHEMVVNYPQDDVDGRTDWEMIANEAGWLLDSYNSSDTVRNEDLQDAREFIREYNRNNLPVWGNGYSRIEDARRTVNEYNRLVRFVNRLKKMGLYCPYC